MTRIGDGEALADSTYSKIRSGRPLVYAHFKWKSRYKNSQRAAVMCAHTALKARIPKWIKSCPTTQYDILYRRLNERERQVRQRKRACPIVLPAVFIRLRFDSKMDNFRMASSPASYKVIWVVQRRCRTKPKKAYVIQLNKCNIE